MCLKLYRIWRKIKWQQGTNTKRTFKVRSCNQDYRTVLRILKNTARKFCMLCLHALRKKLPKLHLPFYTIYFNHYVHRPQIVNPDIFLKIALDETVLAFKQLVSLPSCPAVRSHHQFFFSVIFSKHFSIQLFFHFLKFCPA